MQVMKLLITESSPATRHFLHPKSNTNTNTNDKWVKYAGNF
jgi:hypothetical protein